MPSVDYSYAERCRTTMLQVAEHTNTHHPAWALPVGRVLDHLTMYTLVGSREELECEIEIAMVRTTEDGDRERGEYMLRRLGRIRESILEPAERDELDELAVALAADLERERPVDPEQTRWDAFNALMLASHQEIMAERTVPKPGCLRCCAPKCLCGAEEAARWSAITGQPAGPEA